MWLKLFTLLVIGIFIWIQVKRRLKQWQQPMDSTTEKPVETNQTWLEKLSSLRPVSILAILVMVVYVISATVMMLIQ